jgi:DNA-binding response OmpR family regulator
VKDHGGCIDCMSAPGKGTCFRIYFPASEGAPEETEGAAVKLEPIPSGSETVLIVDDDGSIRTAVKTLLSSAGYNVLLAASGRQAIECYSDLNVPPDLVILDIGMPKMSGWECLASLRQIDPNSRILMATGYGGDELHQKAADLGAVGVILKPFNRRELIRRAREALDR